jgi:GTP-binding protein EngB required for normal cell division
MSSNTNNPRGDFVLPGVHGLLSSLEKLLCALGDEFSRQVEKISCIREQLDQDKIHLAVLGQFKRGKSSFLNALLGENVLPVSVIPLTSVPTYIRYGEERSVRVRFNGGGADHLSSPSSEELRAFLARYVSEEKNPENRLNVEGVELYYDSPLLRRGVVLIDTPGIGSTHQHNTEATLNFLPQCDAAFFLVSADPPVTEVEIAFLKQVRTKIDRVFFILNKIDYLTEAERDEVLAFITRVLAEKAGIGGDIILFPLSARNALEAALLNDGILRGKSGMDLLLERLDEFMSREKYDVLSAALARKTADILHDVEMRVRLAIRSYKIPTEELAQKLALFDEKIREAELQKVLSSDILAGERRRLLLLLEEQSETLRGKARRHLQHVLGEYFARGGIVRENDVREAFSETIPAFFERELGDLSGLFDRRVGDIINLHQRRADEIIDSVRRSASDIFDIPYHPREGSGKMEHAREPYWVLHQWKSSLVPLPDEFVDRLLPGRLRESRIRKRLESQIQGLVLGNVENLRWSTLQNLDMTFRKFMSELDERFTEITGMTREAVEAALKKRKTYSEAVAGEVGRLDELEARLEEMKNRLAEIRKIAG